ncbi:MAG: isopentenyl phosphate kinase family protein [Nitrososphaerales archaeon]|nr:isopentenyl phosphate kinase family protein [Nitrososphaerales archaeon]
MERRKPIIVKLGGALITYKDKPLAINLGVINNIGGALSKSDSPLILVHGGGSFGHYFAEKYSLTTKPSRASAVGVSRTRIAMLKLNLKIMDRLHNHGIDPYPLPPSCFVGLTKKSKRDLFLSLMDQGLTPITYGDVLMKKRDCYILSGDEITRILSDALRPKRVIFLLNVDGIFWSLSQSNSPIEELKPEDLREVQLQSVGMDVTGGMALKLKEALRIARMGIDVIFVNGKDPRRIFKALIGEPSKGTLIRGMISD